MSLIIQGSPNPHSTYTYTSRFYMVFRDKLKYTGGRAWAVHRYHVVRSEGLEHLWVFVSVRLWNESPPNTKGQLCSKEGKKQWPLKNKYPLTRWHPHWGCCTLWLQQGEHIPKLLPHYLASRRDIQTGWAWHSMYMTLELAPALRTSETERQSPCLPPGQTGTTAAWKDVGKAAGCGYCWAP